jgi:hypothetical protein
MGLIIQVFLGSPDLRASKLFGTINLFVTFLNFAILFKEGGAVNLMGAVYK